MPPAPAVPPPPDGSRDGAICDPAADGVRLNRQAQAVWNAMADGAWRSLADLSRLTGHPEASVSARMRDFRKVRFGRCEVQRQRHSDGSGLYIHRLVPRDQNDAGATNTQVSGHSP